jgi:hypothetical protein
MRAATECPDGEDIGPCDRGPGFGSILHGEHLCDDVDGDLSRHRLAGSGSQWNFWRHLPGRGSNHRLLHPWPHSRQAGFDHQEPGSVANAFEAPGTWKAGTFSETGQGHIQNVVFFPNQVSTEIGINKFGDDAGSIYTITSAALTFVSADATTPQLVSLAAFPEDMAGLATLWGGTIAVAGGRIFLNPSGGALGPSGSILFDIQEAQFTVTPIPPSLLLFGAGLALLGMMRYRRG